VLVRDDDADHAQRPLPPERDRVAGPPVRHALSIVGGSAGVPSACSSLTVKVIQSSYLGTGRPHKHKPRNPQSARARWAGVLARFEAPRRLVLPTDGAA
jgi:hypothetical protein